MEKENLDTDKVPIETALNSAGYGFYSFLMILTSGLAVVSFACVGYGSTILVPASACELETTPAQQGLLAAAPVVGSVLGAILWGYLADTRGRRRMLMVSLLGGAVVNCIASISVNWIMLMIFQFIASLFVSGLFSMAMTLLSESVPMVNRNFVVLIVTSISLLSQGIMAVLAMPVIPLSFSIYLPALDIYWNSWRTLILIYSLPCVVTAICVFLLKESPKYMYSKGEYDGAIDALKTIHRVNNLRSKKEFEVKSLLREEKSENQTPQEKSQVVPLFKPPLLKYTLIMTCLFVFQQIGAFLVWLPTIADQFVEVLATGSGDDLTLCEIIRFELDPVVDPDATPCALNVNALLIVLAVGGLQSGVNVIISLIVNYVGRRNIAMVVAAVCGLAGILVNLVPSAIGSAVLFGIQLIGIVALGLYTAIVVAIFPTHLRAIAIALPLTGGRIAVFASIQILNLMLVNNCEAGFYLFCSLFASSAVVASFLPDDRRLQSTAPKQIEEQTEDQIESNNTRTTNEDLTKF